jgi:hypothetical protein
MKKLTTPKKPLSLDTTTVRPLTLDQLPKVSGGRKSISHTDDPSGG